MRRPRLKIIELPACYHIVFSITQGQWWLGDGEKIHLQALLHRVACYCGVEVLTYCIMSHRCHLLIRVPQKSAADAALDPDELMKRVGHLYGIETEAELRDVFRECKRSLEDVLWQEAIADHQARMHDLSVFMKLLKQRFTMWHNRAHDTKGTLWTERFKSILIESREEHNPLHVVASYIDLIPLREGLVERPEDYPYSGYGSATAGSAAGQRGLASLAQMSQTKAAVNWYRQILTGISTAALRLHQSGLLQGTVLGSAAFVLQVLSSLADIRRSVRPQAFAAGGTGEDLWSDQRFRQR